MTKRNPYLTDGQYTVDLQPGSCCTYLRSGETYQVTTSGRTVYFRNVNTNGATMEDERLLRIWVRQGRMVIAGPLAVELPLRMIGAPVSFNGRLLTESELPEVQA